MQMPIALTIDGTRVEVAPGASLLDAARGLRIEIPTLCHEPTLKPQAQCRLCLVEVAGRPRLEPACATPADGGMAVSTASERVLAARRTILELLLSEHPHGDGHDSGRCKLCCYADAWGVRAPTFGFGAEGRYVRENPCIERNEAACVLCSRCARVCDQIQRIGALTFTGRGIETELRAGTDHTLDQTECEMCGNCVAVCPTGALRPRGGSRVPPEKRVPTTCGFCGVGCQVELEVAEGRVGGARATPGNVVNGDWLCVKGRFGHPFIHHPDRLTQPLIRRDGTLQPATWDEALDFVAKRFAEIKAAHGPDMMAVMSSTRCTNEENYLAQKFARAVLGTNSVDQAARA
jgi:predicted molibdopterin-dependent oxidoreductase YjgC